MTQPPTLYESLCTRLNVAPGERGEVWIPCPFCGKVGDRGFKPNTPSKFSFSERGFHCFSCGAKGKSLKYLFDMLVGTAANIPVRIDRSPVEPRKPAKWQTNPEWYLSRFVASLDAFEKWSAYKALLSYDTFLRWRFGVGSLPQGPRGCHHRRLIYPVIINEKILDFRGRALTCDCPKWLSCSNTNAQLWGQDMLSNAEGKTMIIPESPVDAAILMQIKPELISVAGTAGAGTWREEWTMLIAAAKPRMVIVWYDNDLAGAPNQETMEAQWAEKRVELEARRRAGLIKSIPTKPQTPGAVRVVEELTRAGVQAGVYAWPSGTPAKYDMYEFLKDNYS